MSAAISFEVPIRLLCSPNSRFHWAKRAARVRVERGGVRFCAPGWAEWTALLAKGRTVGSGWRVTLVRCAPRKVDDDNLHGLFKGVRDEVAALLGVDDGSSLYRWEYLQEKSKAYSIRIQVEAL